jgi:hypothetical protein
MCRIDEGHQLLETLRFCGCGETMPESLRSIAMRFIESPAKLEEIDSVTW